jgi:transposase-like protein
MLKYWEIYQMKGERHVLRQRMVSHAREHGIKATCRTFGCSRSTVRKWLRRYQPGRPSTLRELSRKPRHCPHQTSSAVEGLVVRLRKQTGYGAERLKMEFEIPCSVGAIARILRQHKLLRARKKKPQTKKQLRAVKRQWKLFSQLSADTKYLQDIPVYWPQMKSLRLPSFQYTVREVVSGLTFIGYADEISKTYACLMAERVSAHLAWCGVDLGGVEWQTDNGCEFQQGRQLRGLPATVRSLGSNHHFIPVKAHTWQSDVETVHRLQEDEFFDRETFQSRSEFWSKVATYWYHFNIARKNRGKEWKSPLQIIRQRNPSISPAIASCPPLDLPTLHRQYFPRYRPQQNRWGHLLPVYPSNHACPVARR